MADKVSIKNLSKDNLAIKELIAVSMLGNGKIDNQLFEATKTNIKTDLGLKCLNTVKKGFGNIFQSSEKALAEVLTTLNLRLDKYHGQLYAKQKAAGDAYMLATQKTLPPDMEIYMDRIADLSKTVEHLKDQNLTKDLKIDKLSEQLLDTTTKLRNLETNIENNMGVSKDQIKEMTNSIIQEKTKDNQQSQAR